jgi:hypothetical protein
MSEYQFIHFLAIDRPLDEEQLEFMQEQSSRAEITPWEFTNEYQFGDFHGNAIEMLRRGYDVHLHYANFGIRRLMFRLPAGLPCDRATFDAFCVDPGVEWIADKKGRGGILAIDPEADAGTYDDDLYDASALLPKIAPVRELLIGGDLRPLYLAWLACNFDEESLEPPLPAGLDKLTSALDALADFYAINTDLLAAAAAQSPPAPKPSDADKMFDRWIAKQPPESLRKLVRRLLAGDAAATRAETLSQIRDEVGAAVWPLAKPARTLAELRKSAEMLREQRLRQERQRKEAARRERLAAIAADPDKAIANVEKLVKERSVAGYERAVRELVDLREALGPELGPARAAAVAESLRHKNPQLRRLTSSLRNHGLLD